MNIRYITGNIEEKNGGPGTSSRYLLNELSKYFLESELITFNVDSEYLTNIKEKPNFLICNIITKNKKINYFQGFSFKYILKLITIFRKSDIIFINGLWIFYTDILFLLNLIFRTTVFILPRGSLDPILLNKKKNLFINVIYKYLLNTKNYYFIALSQNEESQIKLSFPQFTTIIAPNGINSLTSISKIIKKKLVTYIGRFSEKKNIENTIKGFQTFNTADYIFELYGDENSYYNYLKSKYESNNIVFCGYIKGEKKVRKLLESEILVLASFSEGIPMAVLEAISCNVKVVISEMCNLPEIEETGVGVFCNTDPNSIAKSLYLATSIHFSEKGKNILLTKYSWKKSSETLINFIKSRGLI